MKEIYDEFSIEDEAYARCYWRRIGFVIFAALALAVILFPLIAKAAPVLQVSDGSGTITVYDEPCALKTVSNLQYRATWTEGKKTFEGCIGPWGAMGVAVAYFDDGSIAVVPLQALKKVTGV